MNNLEESYNKGVTFSTIENNVYESFEINGDKNIFETIVDQFVLDQFSDNQEVTDYISSLPLKDKRMSILSLLGEDNSIYTDILNSITTNKVSKLEHLRDVLGLIRDFIKFGSVERKKFGEIMTPIKELALPMVELIDKYDEEFWKDPTNKVLDSSAGLGTFLILCAGKFMNGLKDFEPNPDLRFKYIVENCLYYGELQARNVFLWLCLIDPNDDYLTNTYFGSFLDDNFDRHMRDVWEVDKFDLIIQNPPYQMRKEGFKKTQPIWHLFVEKSLSLLEEDKYMVMVHPSGWRSVDGIFKSTQKSLLKNLVHLEMYSEKDGNEIFGATTSFDFYLYRNSENDNYTTVKTQKGEFVNVDLKSMEFIPTDNFELFSKLTSDDSEKVEILHSYSKYETRKSWTSREKNGEFKYPCVYTIIKDGTVNKYYSSTKDNGHFGVPKVIWSNGMASVPTVDINGDYGLTQFSYAIADEPQNLNNIKRAMDSDGFINLMKSCYMSSGNRFDRKVLSLFKKDFWKEFI